PRQRIDGDNRICKEICAWAVPTPVVRGGSTKNCVEEAALLRNPPVTTPLVHAPAALSAPLQPSFLGPLTTARRRAEHPHACAAARVKRAGVAGRTDWHLAGCRANNDDVLVDDRRTIPRDRDLDRAILPET